MTEKDCGHHEYQRRKLYRRVFTTILTLLIVILVVIFLVWIILRPQKPHFALHDTTVYAFNVSYSNYLTSNIQVTIEAKNPNNLIGVNYQKLDVHASYRSQQITLNTALPPTYQGHNDVVLWSPFVYGNVVPVSPYLGVALNQDQMTGVIMVNIKINGKLKWKVGTWMSGDYHIYVNCPAYMSFPARDAGVLVVPPVKYQLVQVCSVDVGLSS